MTEHYFSEQPGTPAVYRQVSFRAYGRSYTMTSASGVFAGDRLDLGTAVLLREVPLPSEPGTFLDLGCGYGPIACVLAREVPEATVWAVDVNTRALELTRQNAESLGVAERVRVATPDEVPAEVTFQQIWSNPPVRIGKAALHELLERWLARLDPHGVAWLVVAKNLGADSLQRWLVGAGFPTERQASAKGYRVLAVRPRSAQP